MTIEQQAGPHISTDKRGHAIINGSGIPVRKALELLLQYRSIDDVAAKLQVRVEYIESAVAFAVAAIR